MRPELTIFGLKQWIVAEYQRCSARIAEMEQPVRPNSVRMRFYESLNDLAQTGSMALMHLLVALNPTYFGIPLPELTYLEQSSQKLFTRSISLYKRVGYMFHDMMAIQELFECMDIQPTMKIPEDPAEYESLVAETGSGMKVEVRGVSYKYPGKGEFVLKDVSFVLYPGETLALLGFNGSGNI
jgi:ABC-type multidrug transport system fused ATPase/permease subunit